MIKGPFKLENMIYSTPIRLSKNTLVLILAALLGVSCSNSYSGQADIGANRIAEPGLPHVTLTTSSNVTDEGETEGVLYFAISENSLIFKNIDNKLVNRSSLQVQINKRSGYNVVSKTYELDFTKDPSTRYYDQNVIIQRKTYDLDPGTYIVKLFITDNFSGKQTSSENELKVPNPEAEEIFISNVRFFEKETPEADYLPVNSYHVNEGYDSLKFTFQVTNGIESEVLEIQSTLKRFRADLSPARTMSGKSYRRSSLEYKGLDYTSSDIIQSNLRNLSTNGSVTIENTFADLPNGNYRFEVETRTSEKSFYEVRDFSIKSSNFPQVKSPMELARPLVYLMKKDEYYKILQITDSQELKVAIDSFWLKNIKNAPKANNIIQLYYERVEQANIQFSNYKEGWKTDMGMIYILFGPPLYIDEGFGETSWFYEFDSGSRIPSIKFKDSRYGNKLFPFENYIFERSRDFFNLEYRQVQAWLDGSILYLSQ